MKMKKIFCAVCICVAMLVYVVMHNMNCVTLTDQAGTELKVEEIQPLEENITVSSDSDAQAEFRDVETRESFSVGYLTKGRSEVVPLKKGRWYKVQSNGQLTVNKVRTRK